MTHQPMKWPDTIEEFADDGMSESVNTLRNGVNHAHKDLTELKAKVTALENQQAETAHYLRSRDAAVLLALRHVVGLLRSAPPEHGSWELRNTINAHALTVLELLVAQMKERLPEASKAIDDAREHADCEEKIRELASAIFPNADSKGNP